MGVFYIGAERGGMVCFVDFVTISKSTTKTKK